MVCLATVQRCITLRFLVVAVPRIRASYAKTCVSPFRGSCPQSVVPCDEAAYRQWQPYTIALDLEMDIKSLGSSRGSESDVEVKVVERTARFCVRHVIGQLSD